MRTIITVLSVLVLSGCAELAEQQRARQEAWETLTPQQQMVELERQRVAIEQQRANTAQIESGLRMMQSAQPQFVPIQPAIFQTQSPVHCTSRQRYYGGPVGTDCN